MSELTLRQRKKIAHITKGYRVDNGLTQEELAKRCDGKIHQSYISAIETCRYASSRVLRSVARGIGFASLEQLMNHVNTAIECEAKSDTVGASSAYSPTSAISEESKLEVALESIRRPRRIGEAVDLIKSAKKLVLEGEDIGLALTNSQASRLLELLQG